MFSIQYSKNVVNTNGRNNLRLRNELKQQFKVSEKNIVFKVIVTIIAIY